MQHTSMHQSGNHHEQHTDRNDGRSAKAREGFLGIEHTRDKQDANGTEEHPIGAQFGKQQDTEHAQHCHYGNPGIKAEA